MTKKEIAMEEMDRMPNISNHMMAKKLHKSYPGIFPSMENARTLIRAIRGSQGNVGTKSAVGKSVTPVARFIRETPWRSLMPKSTAEVTEPVVISGKRKVLILSDIHFPFHDEAALMVALEHGYKKECDTVILNGDTIENYGLLS